MARESTEVTSRPMARWRGRTGGAAAALLGVLIVLSVTACSADREFVPYAPTADLVPLLDDDIRARLGGEMAPGLTGNCDERDLFFSWDAGPNASEWREVIQQGEDKERKRVVSFATFRFETRAEIDNRVDEFRESWSGPCSKAGSSAEVSTVLLDGLPSGSFSSRWIYDDRDGVVSVVADRDRQLMMIVAWVEDPDRVPTDSFVDVVNTAWSDFESENRG